MTFTIGGKPVRPGQIADAMRNAMVEQVKEHLRQKFSSIRHPVSGEFPTVAVFGNHLDDVSLRIEGSPELLDIVRARMTEADLEGVELKEASPPNVPKVFLSYAGEDAQLAEMIGRALMAKGIDTWWAGWSLSPGDSIRQKIDEGLSDCTHFVVLLTPRSIGKPWVQTEIDAGFMRKVESRCRFIPLRSDLDPGQLPPLLTTLRSPSMDDFDVAIAQLVSDIHGLSQKPALGPAPAIPAANTGYSPAANSVAAYFVNQSETAIWGDPQVTISELVAVLALTEDDVRDALHELRHFFSEIDFDDVMPLDTLFVEFDAHFKNWKPEQDALRMGVDMLNDPSFPTDPAEIAKRYDWTPRRLNPAIAYLLQRDLIEDGKAMGTSPWLVGWVERKHDDMRRFVRSRT